MSVCYVEKKTGIKKSQKQLVREMRNELVANPDIFPGLTAMLFSKDISKQKQTSDKISEIRTEAEKKGRNYEGVSHFLDQKHTLSDSNEAQAEYLAPQYIEENYIRHYVEQNVREGKNATVAEAEVIAQIKDSAIEKEIGTLQHALIQALFDTNGNTNSQQFKDAQKAIKEHLNDTSNEDGVELENGRTLRDIVTEANPSLTDDTIVRKLTENAVRVYTLITSKPEYTDAQFFSECNIYADDVKTSDIKYKGIKGIADLIIVKKDGSVDIIDFKVCTRPYDQWIAAKQYHTEYQLGVYRQILAQHGIDGSKIGLFILPIKLEKNNAEDTYVEGLQNVLRASSGHSPYSRLHWNYGIFTSNIKYLIPTKEEMPVETALTVNDSAMELFHELVDYNPAEKNYTKEEIIEKKLHEIVENGKKVYYFYDRYQRKRITDSDKEYFTKNGGYIDNYINKLKNIRNEWVRDLYDAILEYKSDPNGFNPSSFDFLKTKGKGQIETIMAQTFGEFVKWYYEPVNIPVLMENGILAFTNKKTGTTHFVVITDQALTSEYAKGKYGSILGNFYSTDEIRNLPGVHVLPAQSQYAEMLKAVHIINMIAEASPEYFKDKNIGNISVLNPEFGENNSVPVTVLIDNYSVLCNKSKIKNHFLDSIRLADPWEDFGFQLENIENACDIEEDKKFFKNLLKSHKANINSKYGKIQELIRLRKRLEDRYPRFKVKEFVRTQRYDVNDPIDNLFVMVSELILYYQNIPVDSTGNFDKYGIHVRSLMELLGLPFVDNVALGDRGIFNGLYSSSAENSPSPTLRALSEYYQIAFGHIREKFQKQHTIIEKITTSYINSHVSKTNQILSGISTNMWEKLLLRDSNGKIAETLSLINPYKDTSLDNSTREFLKAILWEINKYRFYNQLSEFEDLNYIDNKSEIEALISSNDNLIKLIQSGRYFELPLKRARYFERWKKVGRIGLKSLLTKEIETLKDDWDLTQTHGTQKSMILKELKQNATTMYNQYDLSPEDREFLIKQEGTSDFELDLDYLALDVAFQTIRKDYVENVLQTTAACATLLHVNQALTGINRHPELEALDVREKSALKNEGDISEEMQDVAKGVSALRKLNGLLVLAFRPLQLIKELTFGQFTNYSRVFGTKGSSDALTMKSVFNANKTIWGQSVGKWATAFTNNGDIASYTLCEWLNKTYGIANEDISRTVESSMRNRVGVLANMSKYMYIANSAPDYFNRMTLFVAKMMEDGCFEAHHLNKDGELIYDFKKDARFSELVKYGLNSNYRGEKYLEQKGLYLAMCEQFQLEGRNFIEYDKDGNVIYKEFDRAYTTKQRNSIKEVADLAYGYYDHETKSLVDLGFFGLIYKQFQTFLTAKQNLWFKGRPSTRGDNTSQGSFQIVEKNGEKCYRRIITDENNNIIDVKIVPESQCTEEEKNTLDYAYQWQGDYVEGLAYSIMMTLHDLFHLNWKEIKNNKYRRANVALALHDILIGIILFEIFKWLFSGGTKKMQDIKPVQRVVLRAMQDVSPAAITSLSWEPGFYSTVMNLRDDAIKIFSDGDVDIEKMLTRRIGAIKDWTWNEHD